MYSDVLHMYPPNVSYGTTLKVSDNAQKISTAARFSTGADHQQISKVGRVDADGNL